MSRNLMDYFGSSTSPQPKRLSIIDQATSHISPSLTKKHLRPNSAGDAELIKSNAKNKRRKTIAECPMFEGTPALRQFSRRDRTGLRSSKRYFDRMLTSLPLLDRIFGSKYPSLRLSFTRKLNSDEAFKHQKHIIKEWCHEIKNPGRSLLRPAVDVTFVEPPSSIDGLTSLNIIICHPDETPASQCSSPSFDVLCTLARGGLVLDMHFTDAYRDSEEPLTFPPPIPELQLAASPHSSPISRGSTLRDHLVGENVLFPSVRVRSPSFCSSGRPLLDGMTVSLAGNFVPPSPPFSLMKVLLKWLGARNIVTEKSYTRADLVLCSNNFKKISSCQDAPLKLCSEEDEMKFLLYWRRRNMDVSATDAEHEGRRVPRCLLFNDYTPIRASRVTPFRAQLYRELTIVNSDPQTETRPNDDDLQDRPNDDDLQDRPNDDDAECDGAGLSEVSREASSFVGSCQGRIFVKTSWLVQSIVSWQLEVPHLFLPLALKTTQRIADGMRTE
eukprot:GHVH01012715.1.p1 GENE.GHVH01012715.1~~GHVH01012715.1.p1  ORF type:complete len:499 (+),score=54.40 GHVH01012715.1:74-1570(+)